MAPYIAHHLCNHSPVCTLDRLKFAEKKPKKLPVLIDTYSLWANSRIHFVNFQYLKYCNNSSILYLLFSFSERRLQQVFQKKFVLLGMNFGCQFHWIDGMGFLIQSRTQTRITFTHWNILPVARTKGKNHPFNPFKINCLKKVLNLLWTHFLKIGNDYFYWQKRTRRKW